jgi:hypothetical protein
MRNLILTLPLIALTGAASAHTPYLAPFNFAPTQPIVTVQNALTDNTFFVPEFPIKGDDYEVTDAGGTVSTGKGISLAELGLFETKLPREGTYRISTGNRDVRTLTLAQIDGKWKPVKMPENGVVNPPFADQSKLPTGTKVIPVKTMVRAETYISYNKPSDRVPPPANEGLEIAPITHPNRVFAGQSFAFTLLFDGKPVTAEYQVFRANDAYARANYSLSAKAAEGDGRIEFSEPGIYVIEVSRNWTLGNPDDPRTWLTSLTLEVAP